MRGAAGSRTVPSMRLLLIRHGQTPSIVEGILDAGYPGPGLTALGHEQARAVPEALRGEDVAGRHVSRLLRAPETAGRLVTAVGTSPRLTAGLEEFSAGVYDIRRGAAATEADPSNRARWSAGER